MKAKRDTPHWAMNIKKAQASHFILHRRGRASARDPRNNNVRDDDAQLEYVVQEESGLGRCEAKYIVRESESQSQVPIPRRAQRVLPPLSGESDQDSSDEDGENNQINNKNDSSDEEDSSSSQEEQEGNGNQLDSDSSPSDKVRGKFPSFPVLIAVTFFFVGICDRKRAF